MENVDNVIQTEGLSKTFGEVQALKSLDLSVPKHSIFGFLGPNGAGKTTTMKILLGLSRATEGSATVFGLDINQNGVEIRERIVYLPQQPHFIDYMTARETLRFAASFFFKGPGAKIESRVSEMLKLVGLQHKVDRVVRSFSGGERQCLCIAQAQINYPDLLHKENRQWRSGFRWLVQTVIWFVVLNGLVVMTLFIIPSMLVASNNPDAGSFTPVAEAVNVFFQLGPMVLAVGTIILTQDMLIAEKQSGVAEWLLSKPLSRSAYFLAKLVASLVGVSVLLVGFQTAIAYGMISVAHGGVYPIRPYLVGVAGLALHTFFT